MPSRRSWNTSAPIRSAPAGISVGGAISRMRFSIRPSSRMFDRATRECAMSPQIATVSRVSVPLRRRIVSASSSAWVGCSCRPSPAFSTAQFTFEASRFTAPDDGCRTTSRSGCIAFSVIAVSISVSPFFTELCATDMFITLAPSRLPASSKLACVRVEASKNMLIWVRPLSASARLSAARFSAT